MVCQGPFSPCQPGHPFLMICNKAGNMHNVMVTGGAGFIGSNFVRYLLANEPEVRVINLDALTYAGRQENLAGLPSPERHFFVHGDICDRELVDSLLRHYTID